MPLIELESGISAEAHWEAKCLTWEMIFYKDIDKRQKGEAYDCLLAIVAAEELPDVVRIPVMQDQESADMVLLSWAWGQAKKRGAMNEFGYGRKPGEVVKAINIFGEAK